MDKAMPSPCRPLRALAVILGAVALATGSAGTAAADVPPTPQGYTLVWSDDFNGPSGSRLDPANWIYDIGTMYPCQGCPQRWGTNEVETMTDSTNNVFQDGAGNLVIRALKGGGGATQNWTSGRVETQRTDFAAPDGGILRVQGSIHLPNVTGPAAQGYWPAFWMLGAPFRGNYLNWPRIGEIDILENRNGLNTLWVTLHCGVPSGGPCREGSGIGGSTPGGTPSLQTAFHTYAMELDRSTTPQQIRWYLDGVHFFTILATAVDATTWENATNHGFFIILNLAIGGGFPGNPTANTVPGHSMLIDYVAVYTSQREVAATGSAGGDVPATLALTLGAPPSFGAFTPGLDRLYTTSLTANVVSSAGDATLSVADPSPTATGHLVNGPFALPQPLRAGVDGAPAPVGSSAAPALLRTYTAPVSNDAVTVAFEQPIAATDPLRTGVYAKTLVFTLATTTP